MAPKREVGSPQRALDDAAKYPQAKLWCGVALHAGRFND
jgi:hypothetical protein